MSENGEESVEKDRVSSFQNKSMELKSIISSRTGRRRGRNVRRARNAQNPDSPENPANSQSDVNSRPCTEHHERLLKFRSVFTQSSISRCCRNCAKEIVALAVG